MKTATLKEVAPSSSPRLSFLPNDAVWQLNLDQVEAESGRILKKVIEPYSEAGSSTQPFDCENVLYSKLRPYLNKVVCPDAPGIATTELVPLRPDPARLDRQYLTCYLRSSQFVRWASNAVAGAKMPRVSMKVFWEHQIPLPPLAEQKRIAGILDAADALRAKRRESLAQLDTLLQSTFLTLFGDPVTNPMGWEVVQLGELGSEKGAIVDGPFGSAISVKIDYSDSGDVPVVRTKNVSPFEFVTNDLKFITEEKFQTVRRSEVLPGDIILTKVGTIGHICFFPNSFTKGVLSTTGSCRIRPDLSMVHPIYLARYLHAYRPQMLEIAATGVQPFLNMKHIKGFSVFLPPLELQRRFADIVESIERQKSRQRAHLAELDALFASLQSRAFSGEL